MQPITIHMLPEDFREPPIYFFSACKNYRQNTMHYWPGLQDFYQILFVVSGTGILRCNGKEYPLSRGTAFFTAEGQASEYLDTGSLHTAFLTVMGSGMESLLAHYGCGRFLYAPEVDPEPYLSHIDGIIREYYDHKREGILSAMAYRFYVEFLEQQTRKPPTTLDRICLHMEENFSRKLTLEQLAAVEGISVSKLCHDFKSRMGCSVFQHILNLRLTYARNLLRAFPEAAAKEVAAKSGFEDVSYFCKAYKKKFGKTPTQDRETP